MSSVKRRCRFKLHRLNTGRFVPVVDADDSDLVLAHADTVVPHSVPTVEGLPDGTDFVGIIVRHAFLEEAIIRRISDAVAIKDKDAVYALATELVAATNE